MIHASRRSLIDPVRFVLLSLIIWAAGCASNGNHPANPGAAGVEAARQEPMLSRYPEMLARPRGAGVRRLARSRIFRAGLQSVAVKKQAP